MNDVITNNTQRSRLHQPKIPFNFIQKENSLSCVPAQNPFYSEIVVKFDVKFNVITLLRSQPQHNILVDAILVQTCEYTA